VRRIFVAGEPGGSIPRRGHGSRPVGCIGLRLLRLSDIFGSCAGMCEQKTPALAEDHILVEVLDPPRSARRRGEPESWC